MGFDCQTTMDLLHIEARYQETVELPKDFVDTLPEEVALFTTIQFLGSKEALKN